MPPAASAPPYRLPWYARLAIALAAVLAQAWVLELPFQMDDYLVLEDPAQIFRRAQSLDPVETRGVEPFMMRWTPWAVWAGYRELLAEPLSPVPFHAAALLLHAAVSLLLASAVNRLLAASSRAAPQRERAGASAWLPGALAGTLFALQSGGIQAVSWSCAWGDIFYCLFGLAALLAFLRARRPELAVRATNGSRRWRALALGSTLLTLLSKEPAAMTVPALWLLLGAVAWSAVDRRKALRSFLLAEALPIGLVLLLVLAARKLYLGSAELRYITARPPALAEIPAVGWRGLCALVQALYPWNREPIFADIPPWLGRHGLASGALSLCFLAALAGALLGPLRRLLPLLISAGLALLLALPAGIIYTGAPNNAISRALYLPLLASSAALGIGIAGYAARPRLRPIAAALFLLAVLLALDGRAHVAATERLAAAEIERSRALVADAVAEHAAEAQRAAAELPAADSGPRELVILFVTGDSGYGGIPLLGDLAELAYGPVFTGWQHLEVRDFDDQRALLEALPDDSLARRDLVVIGPTIDPSRSAGLAGAELRAARAAVHWSPLASGRSAAAAESWTQLAGGASYAPPEPLWPHALLGLYLEVAPGPTSVAELAFEQPPHTRSLRISLPNSPAPRRLTLLPSGDRDFWLGAPIRALHWRSEAELLAAPRALAHVPALALLEPPARAVLAIEPERPPVFRVVLPAQGDLPPELHLELRILLVGHELPFAARLPLAERGAAPGAELRFQAQEIELGPLGPTAAPSGAVLDWADFARQVLLPGMAARGRETLQAEWRVALVHAGGLRAAQSPWRPISLAAAPR